MHQKCSIGNTTLCHEAFRLIYLNSQTLRVFCCCCCCYHVYCDHPLLPPLTLLLTFVSLSCYQLSLYPPDAIRDRCLALVTHFISAPDETKSQRPSRTPVIHTLSSYLKLLALSFFLALLLTSFFSMRLIVWIMWAITCAIITAQVVIHTVSPCPSFATDAEKYFFHCFRSKSSSWLFFGTCLRTSSTVFFFNQKQCRNNVNWGMLSMFYSHFD